MAQTSHMAKSGATGNPRFLRQDNIEPPSHNASMKSTQPLWRLKQWRKFRGYTQERLAEMVDMAPGYLSDLEKGKRRFNQDHLEAFAAALNTTPGDLINADPTSAGSIYSIWERVPEPEREQAKAVLETFTKKTGTGG